MIVWFGGKKAIKDCLGKKKKKDCLNVDHILHNIRKLWRIFLDVLLHVDTAC